MGLKVFGRWVACGVFAMASVGCSSSFQQRLTPAGPVAPATTTKHLYVIVTTKSEFVAEYPIVNGIPGSKPDRVVTGFVALNALAVDSSGHLWVLDLKTIEEFARGANGPAKPIREIEVPSFLNIDTLAVDANGYIYVGQKGHVYVYAPSARGHAKPIANLKPVGYPAGLTTGASGDFYALTNTEEFDPYRTFQTHVSVYSAAPQLQSIRQFCSYEESNSGIDYGIVLNGGNAYTAHTYFIGSAPHGEIDLFPARADKCPRGASAKIITKNPSLLVPIYLAIDPPYLYVADVWYGYGGVIFTLKTTGSPQKPLSILNVENGNPHNIFGIALGP